MSKSALKWIIIFLFSILLLYSAYWLIVSSQFKSQVSSMVGERNNISYQSMFVSGFPYRMNMQIENLEIRNEFTEMKTDQLFIDLNPFDLEKIMLRIPKINGDVIIENEVLNFTATNLAARIDFKEQNFDSLRLISDKIDTNYLQTNIAEFNKIKFYIISNNFDSYNVEIKSIGNTNFYSADKTILIELIGNIENKNNELNGEIQLNILNNDTNETIFSMPLNVINGELLALFFPIFNFRDLFSSI